MKSLLRLAVLLVFATACKKPVDEQNEPQDPTMPTRTEVGADIVACKVNGNIHIYQGKFSWNHPRGVSFGHYIAGGYTFISANEDKYTDNIDILLYTLHIEVGKEYVISKQDGQDLAQYYIGEGTKKNTYVTRDETGKVKFTRCDSLVVAGIFSFTAFNPASEKVEITEGFFDISRKE